MNTNRNLPSSLQFNPGDRVKLKDGTGRAFPTDPEVRTGTVIDTFTAPVHDPNGMPFAQICFDDGDDISSFPFDRLEKL